MKGKKITIGQLLMKSLTAEQIACMLDVVASAGGLKSLMDDFTKADPDMAATVGKLLNVNGNTTDGKTKGRLTSHKRTMEYWNSLWRYWHEIVAQLGNEEGKYAVQDHHWEEPYFDGSFFASDLEPIARDMLALIDDVYNSVGDPDLYLEALVDIEESIASYPEWMGVEYGEPSELEKNATYCVLKWLWSDIQQDPHPGITLIEKFLEFEDSFELIYLNQNACVEFFVNLPAKVCREIYTYLQDESHAIDQGNVYSLWHQINHDYESRYDSAKYLESCRRHLSQNWRYGRPLVDDAFNQKDFKEADRWLEKTFSSFLKRKRRVKWYPELSLLYSQHEQYMVKGRGEIAELLQIWSEVSLKMNDLPRGAAAKLQSVIFRLPTDCEAIIKEYKRMINPKIKNTLNPLFEQWKIKMAERSFSRYMDAPPVSDSWVHWLIEASLDHKKRKDWFLRELNRWLTELKKDKRIFKKQWHWLARFTTDLPGSETLEREYPVFYETALPEAVSSDDLLGNFRSNGLKKMKAGPCLSVAMDVWNEHLNLIVPDPANSYKSDYTDHASWCKAVFELNQKNYNALLSKWRKKHNRRRNLWRDMRAIGLPV